MVKVLLIVGLWLAGWGAARLAAVVVPEAGLAGEFVAATLAIWNPYVAERLLQGHWSLLVGYGCLPWVAAAVLRLRDGRRLARVAAGVLDRVGRPDADGPDAGGDASRWSCAVPGAGRSRLAVRGGEPRRGGSGRAALAGRVGGVGFAVVRRRRRE